MRIKKVDIYIIYLPLKEPFIISYDRYENMPVILVKIELQNGLIGWGEAVPDQHVTGETEHTVVEVLKNELGPLLIDLNPFQIELIHHKMNKKIWGNPSAKAAIDCALYDLMGKITNQPVYQLIGGQANEKLTAPQVISIKSPIEMSEDARRIVSEGFSNVKIKVGTDVETDIERIRAVRNAIPKEVKLRVDANQGWDRIGALTVIKNTKDCLVEWYEQPVLADDILSLQEIRSVSHAKIMIDEGVHSPQGLLNVIRNRSADMVNIKLMKAGGIYPSLAIANMAEVSGMPCQLGSMVESAIGTMAGAHLSIARRIIQTNELVGPFMFSRDVDTVVFEGDVLQFPDLPGLGVQVDEELVGELTEVHKTVE
ncbi:mandelate racemase/muconate lactonizing enzyme family protein [Sporosarcina ureilytica]|uniref:Dipeptide epimerase n=1 Tax=Sporosarcina ureilytica TaxID=298596 RepID=A0A1D8JH22_9BACL|nr:dipeptide epimerase [Sporosarcina ureilytica]AOV08001.1 dipeptide epimerase [Sporosarcina ureilytica]